MGYAFPADTRQLIVGGPAFRSTAYAERFFGVLRTWNYGAVEDRDNNVRVSFIVETPPMIPCASTQTPIASPLRSSSMVRMKERVIC